MARLLIVDDDRETLEVMSELLAQPDRQIDTEHNPQQALHRVRAETFELLVSDVNFNASITGLDLLRAFKAANPAGQVVLMTGFGALDTAIDAQRAGAFDFISKPFSIVEVKAAVGRALAAARQTEAPARPPPPSPPSSLLGRSPAMMAVYNQIARVADSNAPVLIAGESGTGKELVARAIHDHSARAARPLVSVNCGALAESLLESELFGHVQGAFTGAVTDKKGILEQAHTGSVFLDEIGETSPALQVKLLRALEDGEVRLVGSTRSSRFDVRVLAATNVDLEQAVAEQRFRLDLYYRLSVIVIRLPPLRDRQEDIPLLATHFLGRACARAGQAVQFAPAVIEAFGGYHWPGNVRELENLVERLVVFNRGGTIALADLPADLRRPSREAAQQLFQDLPTLEELERRYLRHVLEAIGGNRSRAAEIMGIDRRTLYRMAERFGLDLTDD